jgi:WD40 repeat protein
MGKRLSLTFLLVITILLAACGGDDKDQNKGKNQEGHLSTSTSGDYVWQYEDGYLPDPATDYVGMLDVTPDDTIYLLRNTRIEVFNADGALQNTIQIDFEEPKDIALDETGSIWLVTWKGMVYHLDQEGKVLSSFNIMEKHTSDSQELVIATARKLALGPDGNLYIFGQVAQSAGGYGQIEVWSREGEHLRTIRTDRDGDSTFKNITFVIGPDGSLYLASPLKDERNFIRVFDAEGNFVADREWSEIPNRIHPTVIALASDDTFYIGGTCHPIYHLDSEATVLGTVRQAVALRVSDENRQIEAGKINEPKDIGVLSNGDLIISDADGDSMQLVRMQSG